MTKLDEICATFERAYTEAGYSSHSNNCRTGLSAVIHEHVQPMIAAAYAQGLDDEYARVNQLKRHATDEDSFAARIIKELLEP